METTLLGRSISSFPLPTSAIPPSGISWFTIGDCNHASKRHVIAPSPPPPPFPRCRYQKRYSTALNRATHTGNLHTHIGRNSSANKRDRKGQQESRLRDRRDRKRVGGRIENRSGDKWFSRKSAQDILLFASF